MILSFGFFVLFTFFIFGVNFILIASAWITHTKDEFVNKDKPLVSILVPAYNEEVVIVESIKSLLNQDYDNYEIIIIDDGSSDKTFDIASKHFDKHDNVTILKKVNGGKAMALNYAAQKAKGER